ncbi:MAG: hypothetical protein CMA11_01505 [Euryarchaeota archaeon]|nr:hypothetical protein [Euryarchaeota archaeon]|tara:strand:- start:1256 stop:3226 length:1971 start_codon:yes stop_codon:yes gene_type:complete
MAMAAIDSEEGGGELWFSCEDINDCSLTEFHIGEQSITGTVNSASPLSPETVFIELPMHPEQSQIALIPDLIDELQVDLRFQDDLIGLSRPDLQVTIIIAESTTVIEFEDDPNPTGGLSSPYFVEDEPLNNDGNRLFWPGEEIRILLQFEIERPGTWELNLRGASFMLLDIIWSEDVESRNVDEPSSDGSPRMTQLDTNHYGALVEDDRDCWTFEVEDHELLRITFVWEEVPSEIEQSHGQPDLILPDRRLAPTPELETEVTNGETRMTWQWRALPTGEYDLCIGGRLNAFQPYQWAGLIAFEGIGPTSPEQFDYSSWQWEGFGMKAEEAGAKELNAASGLMVLILSLAVLVGLFIEVREDTTSKAIRFGIFVPGVLVLILGGIISPLWAISGEVQSSDEDSLDDLIDKRLDQLWHASHPSTPASSRSLHVGATFGMLDGETLSVRLESDAAWPLDDGRWQLHIPALYELDFEAIIFAKVAEKGTNRPVDDMLDSHSRTFILLAARTLMLDILMLEALLVVDEVPDSNVIHFKTEMKQSGSLGLIQDPTWGTRPIDIPEGRWRLMQDNLYPNLISITMLDGAKDDLEFRVQINNVMDHNLMYSTDSVQPSEPLLESQYLWVIAGVFLVVIGIGIENRRRNKAKQILKQLVAENMWN